MTGQIVTSGDQLIAYVNGRFHSQHDFSRTGRTHVEAVRAVARKVFGTGTLRKYQSCELPTEGFARWGWTRDNRFMDWVSILVDHYEIR